MVRVEKPQEGRGQALWTAVAQQPWSGSWPFSLVLGALSPSLAPSMGRQWKPCQTLFFGALKSLQMVTAAKKLKDAYSLEGKL